MTLRISGGRVLLPDLSASEADVLVDPAAGEILDVGPDLTGDTELDATGGLVIPGFVSAHTHAPMTLFRGYADDKPVGAWLREDVWPIEAELTGPDIRAGAELGTVEMIRSGTTTFADMYFGVDFEALHLTLIHDPVRHLVYAARGSDVRHTVCDGDAVMRDRELLTLDEERVRREAAERASELVTRASE